MPVDIVSASLSADPVELARAVFFATDDVRARRRRILRIVLVLVVLILAGLLAASLVLDWQPGLVWRYEAVALLGVSVGAAELLSRYRDAPSLVLLSPPGIGYVVINALASAAALGLILTFGWKFGATGEAAAVTQVLVAGFGAMALFRSSLLTVKVGSDDVGIGPSSVLSVMMAASDRAADRLRAADRAGRVTAIMEDVSYAKASDPLPTVAMALMQNLSPADAAALNIDLEALKGADLPDGTKALLLGLKLTNVVSTAVLIAAKESLGREILHDPPAPNGESNGHGYEGSVAAPPPGVVGAVMVAADAGSASEGLPQTPQTPGPGADKR